MSGVVATDATEATMLETLATGIEQGLNEVMSELNEQVMVAATEVNNVEEPAAAANEPEPEQVTEQPVEIVDPVEPVVDSTENETERAIEEQTMEKVEPVEPVAVAEAEPEPIAIETMEKVEQEEPAEPIVTVEQLPMEPKPVEQSMLTTIIPAVEPVQVLDSVLNYVNASFMPAEQDLPKVEPEVELETSQLRRYDGAQLWRIVVQTDKDKKLADELQSKYDGQLWKEVKQEVDYLLKPQVLAAAERHIRSANLSRIVLIDNLQQVIEVENPPAEKIAELQNRKGHRLTWQAYHRLEDIHGFIDYMAKTYPDICTAETIGYSVEKRPLKILKISNGNPNNPGIWMDGGMHAREWISPATVTYVANQLVEGWEDLPEHMRNINWYIHPVANPDGYEYSHTTDRLWRKNMRAHGRQCPGVDLNRNFGYKWGGKGTSASPCSQTYRGSKAFSEPETFYISKFISGFPRDTFQAYLSFHSYGQYILYPWGYDYQLTKDRADLDRVARQAGSIITKSSGVKYTVGSAATTLYPAAGGSDDWAKGIAGIKYAYTIEMGDTGRYGFVLPAQFIQYNGKDGYTFADTVARAIAQGHNTEARSKSNRRRLR
ncbi:carboxypeptidase A4 [Drosophila busckii]|nr:carboxypeptidase A4 [Drosophila busckii]